MLPKNKYQMLVRRISRQHHASTTSEMLSRYTCHMFKSDRKMLSILSEHSNDKFFDELRHIIEGQGFQINAKKTRLQKLGKRQEVTGLTVSNRVNASSEYIAEIRNILHIWEKYGYNDAYKRFYPRYKEKKGHVKKGEPVLENVIFGKLQYLKMVKGAKDPVYSALQSRYDKLTSPVNADKTRSLDYLRSFTISEFEEIVGTPIQYCLSKKK